MFYLYLGAMLFFDLLGLTLAKLWQIYHIKTFFAGAIIVYALMAIFVVLALKYQGAAITNIIWVSLSAIGMTLVGYGIFKEPIVFRQFIGIAIILFGIIVVQSK